MERLEDDIWFVSYMMIHVAKQRQPRQLSKVQANSSWVGARMTHLSRGSTCWFGGCRPAEGSRCWCHGFLQNKLTMKGEMRRSGLLCHSLESAHRQPESAQ